MPEFFFACLLLPLLRPTTTTTTTPTLTQNVFREVIVVLVAFILWGDPESFKERKSFIETPTVLYRVFILNWENPGINYKVLYFRNHMRYLSKIFRAAL